MVVLNDGTKKFHHQTDGRDQQIAGCLKDFRNKPFPVKAKLEYVKNVITVSKDSIELVLFLAVMLWKVCMINCVIHSVYGETVITFRNRNPKRTRGEMA